MSIAYTYRDDERIRVALQHDGSRARELRELVRRKAMLLWAFSRQDMRESKEGFDPDGGMAGQEFNNETFALDPCRPAIAHLIDDADLKRCARVAARRRRAGAASREPEAAAATPPSPPAPSSQRSAPPLAAP